MAVSGLVDVVEKSIRRRSDSDSSKDDQPGRALIKDMVLGEILAQLGIVTDNEVEEAYRLQNTTGLRIGEALQKIGAATAEQIEEGLQVQEYLRDSSGVAGDLFGAIVPNHPLWEHAFLLRCRAHQLSESDVKTLAGQMYKFCKEFGRILAATFARCPDEYARVVIADNLYDEMGNGKENRTHPELFRRFTRALGISDEELEQVRVLPETQSLIDTYMALPERFGYQASLAAICYASENLVHNLYTQILAGVENGVEVEKDALAFFTSHVALDDEHAHALINVVNRGVTKLDEARTVVLAIKEALAARIRFFDGIERCASS